LFGIQTGFKLLHANLPPAQLNQGSHHQADLVAQKTPGSYSEQESFLGKKACADHVILHDLTNFHLPFQNGMSSGLGAVVSEIMGALKHFCSLFHQLYVQVSRKSGKKGSTKGMTLFPKSKQVEIFF